MVSGMAFYKEHCEVHGTSGQTSKRMLVWMLYLNDVFSGGETYFRYQDLKVRPERENFNRGLLIGHIHITDFLVKQKQNILQQDGLNCMRFFNIKERNFFSIISYFSHNFVTEYANKIKDTK